MNIENMGKLLAWVSNGGDGVRQFAMNYWDCGTACCLGGFAAINWLRDNEDRAKSSAMALPDVGVQEAAEWLGIDSQTASMLFYPFDYPEITDNLFSEDICSYQDITATRATQVVERLIQTGEVDWRAEE